MHCNVSTLLPQLTQRHNKAVSAVLQLKPVHGQETTSMRMERRLAIDRLAALEEIGFALGMMSGKRTRGPKSQH